MTEMLSMQDAVGMAATDLAVNSIRLMGPMSARALYAEVDGFETVEHASRVLASLATREPIRLARRLVDNPQGGQGNRKQVFQYDLVERNFAGTASGPDLFHGQQLSPGEAPAADPAGGDPNNTGSAEDGVSFTPPDPAVGTGEAAGASESAPAAGHDDEALHADLDALVGQREALLSWIGVSEFLDAEAEIKRLRAARHDALNEAAGYRMVVAAMRERLNAGSDDEVPEAFDMCMHDAYVALQGANHPLFDVFDSVVEQVTQGKGERHGGASTPFMAQPWVSIANSAGNGFLVGQGIKKAMESGGKSDFGAWETEMLGAVAYLAMAVLHGRMRQQDTVMAGGVAA